VLAELLNNDEWESVKLGEVCEKICAGGDKPNCFSEIKTEKCSIPIYSNGINNNGLYGYTDVPTIIKPSVTISARGTIGFTAIRRTPFCPIIRLVSVTPKEEILDLNFLYYVLNAFIAKGEGSSIPQLTVPNVKPIQIPFPPLTVQQQIVAKIERIFAEIERIEKAVKIK
jgi:type I restriction enzyme S subunit